MFVGASRLSKQSLMSLCPRSLIFLNPCLLNSFQSTTFAPTLALWCPTFQQRIMPQQSVSVLGLQDIIILHRCQREGTWTAVRLAGVSLWETKTITAVKGSYLIKIRVLSLCRAANAFMVFKCDLWNEKK